MEAQNENKPSELEQLREIFATSNKSKEPSTQQIEEWARQAVHFGAANS